MVHLKKAGIAALVFSILAMTPVLFHLETRKFGPNISGSGSDSYAFLYSLWMLSQNPDGKLRTDDLDLILRAPEGAPLLRHIQALSGLAVFLTKAGCTPILAYNLIIWMTFFAAGFLGFMILSSLGTSSGTAYLGSLLITICPYQSLQAVDHADLAMTAAVLLDIYLLERLLVKNDRMAFPLLILVTGLSIFTHPYYLICLALLNGLPCLWFLSQITFQKNHFEKKYWYLVGASTGAALTAVLTWKSLFRLGNRGIESLGRDIQDLYTYSTKGWDFILPPHFSYLFASLTNEQKIAVTSRYGSNFVENTLYPGFLVLLFFIGGLAVAMTHPKKCFNWMKGNGRVFAFFSIVLLIPTLFSISPTLYFFGLNVPTPTLLIYKIFPQFRTLSRFGYISTIAMILIFCMMLDFFLQRIHSGKSSRKMIQIAMGIFCILDLGYFHEPFYSDSNLVPPVYAAIKNQTPLNSVIMEIPISWGYIPHFWQSYHQRPHRANYDPEDPNFQSNYRATTQLPFPNLLEWSRSQKVDYIVLHSSTDMNLPNSIKFENHPDQTWIYYFPARFSYLIKVP